MKFEQLFYEETYLGDRRHVGVEGCPTFVFKGLEITTCHMCGALTRWYDARMGKPICSEECHEKQWKSCLNRLKEHTEQEQREAEIAAAGNDSWKDILIVVHNQLPYLKICIESILKHTKLCNIYLWDNGSDEPTREYMDSLESEDATVTFKVFHHPENIGFIEPNNKMAAMGNGNNIILLNSDCKVFEGWDRAMTAQLDSDHDLGVVGYLGGALDQEGKGIDAGRFGYDVDFVCGFALAMSRKTYEEHGLFDAENLKFAYGEDSDLCLRMKAAGKKIYALYSTLCYHFGNKTVTSVHKEGKIDMRASFSANHNYIKSRWKSYLENDRVLLNRNSTTWRGKESHENLLRSS